jgi:hypothetical protein
MSYMMASMAATCKHKSLIVWCLKLTAQVEIQEILMKVKELI